MKSVLLLAVAAILVLSSCETATLANRRDLYSPLKKTVVPAEEPMPSPAAPL